MFVEGGRDLADLRGGLGRGRRTEVLAGEPLVLLAQGRDLFGERVDHVAFLSPARAIEQRVTSRLLRRHPNPRTSRTTSAGLIHPRPHYREFLTQDSGRVIRERP